MKALKFTESQYKAKGNYYYVLAFINESNDLIIKTFKTKKLRSLFLNNN